MRYLIAILLFWTNFVHAANQYVDPSFTGTSNGTITNPWKSLSAVNQSTLNTGDSLLLKRGQKLHPGSFQLIGRTLLLGHTAQGKPLVLGQR